MTVVFVHGNPETPVVWHRLIAELAARDVTDVATLSPPGFGAPVPPEWGATAPEYGQWLIERLAEFDRPVDLVGHDWGAGHVFWALANAPERIRSAATDVTGIISPDYVWHDAAQIWRTEGAGEEFVDTWVATPKPALAARFIELGLDETAAAALAEAVDAEMGQCILSLYRSADMDYRRDLMATLERADLPPWLTIDPGHDPYAAGSLSRQVAAHLGLDSVELGDFGHWWMIEGPSSAADALMAFWASHGIDVRSTTGGE